MTLSLGIRDLNKIGVIDDNSFVRDSFKYRVEDLQAEPLVEEGPLIDFDKFIEKAIASYDAVICDYQLRTNSYASFDGARLVSTLGQRNLPGLLVTSYKQNVADEVRALRQHIPIILDSEEFEDVDLKKCFVECIKELNGDVPLIRRTYRSLVYIEHNDLDKANPKLFLKIPGWDAKIGVGMYLNHLPQMIQQAINNGAERLHAAVNLGAEGAEDIFFVDWESK